MDDVTPPFLYSRDSRIKFYLPQICTKKGGKKKLVGLIVCIGSLSEDHRSSETHQYRSDESWESNRPYNRAHRTIIVFAEAASLISTLGSKEKTALICSQKCSLCKEFWSLNLKPRLLLLLSVNPLGSFLPLRPAA